MHDVIIVGGGPAGLSAALILGRARRTVLIIDHGMPRNARSHALHGYLTRDGCKPLELLKLGRSELDEYGVECHDGEVVDARPRNGGFIVNVHDGTTFAARKLLIATGLRDQLPRIDGFADLYGRSIHHCPYCDGWEWRDRRLAALGYGRPALGLALSLKGWSDDVVVLTDGVRGKLRRNRELMRQQHIDVCEEKIARLEGRNGLLKRIIFEDGSTLARDAIFFNTGERQKSSLAEKLGCEFDRKGGVVVDMRERTCVPGLYVCGDASRDVQFAIVAAAEGATAAVAINREFQDQDGRVL